MPEKHELRQYFAALTLNLMSLAHGTSVGWTSPALMVLLSETDPVLPDGPITLDEASWIATLICLGGLVGTMLMGFLVDKIGRKNCLLLNVIPNLGSWILILTSNGVAQICIARFLAGIGSGAVFMITPVFIAEISDDKIRGSLGSIIMVASNLGILLSMIAGYFFSFKIYSSIFISLSVIYFGCLIFLPETPLYLLKTNQLVKAEKSFQFYRNLPLPPDRRSAEEENSKLTKEDFFNKAAKKAFVIGGVLMFLQQFNGLFAMMNYTALIFDDIGISWDPNLAAIIVALMQFIAGYLAIILVDRFGRKSLIIFSSFGAFIGLFGLAIFIIFNQKPGTDLENLNWISVIAFAVAVFAGNIGIVNLQFLIISEIFSDKIKSIANSICMLIMWVEAFFIIKYMETISHHIGMEYCFFFFGLCCLIGGIFVIIYLPETKGKRFEEIERILSS